MEDKQLDLLINEQFERQKAIRQEQEDLKIDSIYFQKECLEIFANTQDTKPEELNQTLKKFAQGNPKLQDEIEEICDLIDEYHNTVRDLQSQDPSDHDKWLIEQIRKIEELLQFKLTDIIDRLSSINNHKKNQ